MRLQLGPGFHKKRADSLAGATRGTLAAVARHAARRRVDARCAAPTMRTWQAQLREAAFASGRLATVLVDHALERGTPAEDLLAVVVRAR